MLILNVFTRRVSLFPEYMQMVCVLTSHITKYQFLLIQYIGFIKNCPTFEKWVEIVIKINTYSIIGKYALLNSIYVRFNNSTKYISNIFKQLLNPLKNHNNVVIIV